MRGLREVLADDTPHDTLRDTDGDYGLMQAASSNAETEEDGVNSYKQCHSAAK